MLRRSSIQRTGFKPRSSETRFSSFSQESGKEKKAKALRAVKLKAGRKTKEWDRVRARLKVKYAAMGITTCELGYPGCKHDDWLSFAHGRKRRYLVGDELETLTILACCVCHDRIEVMPPEAMLAIVQSVIADRVKENYRG